MTIEDAINTIKQPAPVELQYNWELSKLIKLIQILNYKDVAVYTSTFSVLTHNLSTLPEIKLFIRDDMTDEKEDMFKYTPFADTLIQALKEEFPNNIKIKKGVPMCPVIELFDNLTSVYPFNVDSPFYKYIAQLKGFRISVPKSLDDLTIPTIIIHDGDISKVKSDIPFLPYNERRNSFYMAYYILRSNSPMPFGLPYTFIKEVK